jgi:hypothetical protein
MRVLFAALIVLTSGIAAASVPAVAGFPRDPVSLRSLDNQQLRLVRRAGAQCWHGGQGGFGSHGAVARACVMNGTEAMLANLKDPVLKAFSDALPLHVRYDEYRPAYYWQRLVEK